MMRIVFNDLRRETYLTVSGVIQIDSQYSRINGRITNIWMLTLPDGTTCAFPQRNYTIHRVEI